MSYTFEKMVGFERENAKLLEENQTLKERMEKMQVKMTKMESYIKELKSSIRRRALPAELMNELFVSMPLENAFGLLAKMPNGLLARNVQKMINNIKETMKNNKFNEEDCGPKLTISEGGLVAKHSGQDLEANSVRAVQPIPIFNLKVINKPLIEFYFEMEILNKSTRWIHPNSIGFCNQQFSIEDNWLGCVNNSNSIGFESKYGMFIDGNLITIGNDDEYFEEGDFVGLGIIYQPNSEMECFSTLDGKFIGKYQLPSQFSHLQLFAAIILYASGDSIRVNFGQAEWQFKEFERVLQ